MGLIQRKVKIKDHVIFDNQSYAGMTGVTEYKEMYRSKYEFYDAICLEENDFEFID